MENTPIKSRNHFFLYILLVFVVTVGVLSYYRFSVKHDYYVGYNGSCDPSTESCFVQNEDGTDTKSIYFSKMKKYAPDLFRECGSDITNCSEANICLSSDHNCSKIYCDKNIGEDNCSNPPTTLNDNATITKK